MRVTDLTFHTNHEFADTDALLSAQRASLLYVDRISQWLEIEVVKHVTKTTRIVPRHPFRFFYSRNAIGYILPATVKYLRQSSPDVIIVHGFHFPLQVIRLKRLFGHSAQIVLWHHAERPVMRWPKKWLYRMMDRCVSAYLFTSKGNASEWTDARIIRSASKIAEVPPTLSSFSRLDQTSSRRRLGFAAGPHYLWVGRLDMVKDPITVLEGCRKAFAHNRQARLHMIYQSGALVHEVRELVASDPILRGQVLLHGAVPNRELDVWYTAADFCISGSRREAGSVTILEAMSCGCIPIVTAIPPSLQVTGGGQYALVYEPGNANDLCGVLQRSISIDREKFSKEVATFFQAEYSVDAIARKLYEVCASLVAEKPDEL